MGPLWRPTNNSMEIIYIYIFLINEEGALWTEFIWPKLRSNVDFREYGNVSSFSMKGVEPCKPYEQLIFDITFSLELATFQSEI
jgi:hypothetical protein